MNHTTLFVSKYRASYERLCFSYVRVKKNTNPQLLIFSRSFIPSFLTWTGSVRHNVIKCPWDPSPPPNHHHHQHQHHHHPRRHCAQQSSYSANEHPLTTKRTSYQRSRPSWSRPHSRPPRRIWRETQDPVVCWVSAPPAPQGWRRQWWGWRSRTRRRLQSPETFSATDAKQTTGTWCPAVSIDTIGGCHYINAIILPSDRLCPVVLTSSLHSCWVSPLFLFTSFFKNILEQVCISIECDPWLPDHPLPPPPPPLPDVRCYVQGLYFW